MTPFIRGPNKWIGCCCAILDYCGLRHIDDTGIQTL